MMVEIGMKGGTSILAQLEPTATPTTTAPIISYSNYRSKSRC